mgnify:CR=1 FL=1
MSLLIYHIRVTVRATTSLLLDMQSGGALRGALTNALWHQFCTNKTALTCASCPLVAVCPVAALVAPLREEGQKGGDQHPRPYVIKPPLPLEQHVFQAGDLFQFGIGLFGQAVSLFPYVVLAIPYLEEHGVGKKLPELGHRRGRFEVEMLDAVSPLTGATQVLYQRGQAQSQMPILPLSATDIDHYAQQLSPELVTLDLHTPVRLLSEKQLVHQISLRPLIQRLMRRLDDLSMRFGNGSLDLDWAWYVQQAAQVQVVNDQTHWLDVMSYSERQGRHTPIGGLIGRVTFAGDLTALRSLLVWGSLIHVGKNAVKGDGWYSLVL